jgi:hypothetical protein
VLGPGLGGTPPGQAEKQESDGCASEIRFCGINDNVAQGSAYRKNFGMKIKHCSEMPVVHS